MRKLTFKQSQEKCGHKNNNKKKLSPRRETDSVSAVKIKTGPYTTTNVAAAEGSAEIE